MVLETLVAVVEVCWVGMTTLVVEETSVVKAALVAAVVVVDMAAVGMDTMDLVMMEAILEVAEATMILAVTTINLQILNQGKEETLEAEVLAPMVVEANTLPNHKTKVALEVPATAVAMAVAEVLITARKQSLAGEESQRRDREATGHNRFVNSAKHSGGRA